MPLKELTVCFEANMLAICRRWTELSPQEVNWVFLVDQREGQLVCHSPEILKQRVLTDGLHVSYDQDALFDWQEKQGFLEDANPYATYGIGHSHGPAGVFFSGEDKEMSQDHCARGFLVHMILNHAGEMKTRVDSLVGNPDHRLSVYTEVPHKVKTLSALSAEQMKEVDAQFKAAVTYYSTVMPSNDLVQVRFGGNAYGYMLRDRAIAQKLDFIEIPVSTHEKKKKKGGDPAPQQRKGWGHHGGYHYKGKRGHNA